MRQIPVTLLAVALVSAGAALAQDFTAERTSTSPLGTLTMPHDVRAEGGEVAVDANVSLHIAEAREAGATLLSISAGNEDAPTGVQVSDLTLETSSALPEPTWTDGEGTSMQHKNFDISELPDELEGTVSFSVAYPEGAEPFDMEIVILAMDDSFAAVNGTDGSYMLQSWTGVHPQGEASFQDAAGNETLDENETDDEAGVGEDQELAEEAPEEAADEEQTPAPGIALALLAIVGLAVALRRRG